MQPFYNQNEIYIRRCITCRKDKILNEENFESFGISSKTGTMNFRNQCRKCRNKIIRKGGKTPKNKLLRRCNIWYYNMFQLYKGK